MQVRPNWMVLDPFMGSGSVLTAVAHYGGAVFGADMDPKFASAGI